jgi:hypothetical protein
LWVVEITPRCKLPCDRHGADFDHGVGAKELFDFHESRRSFQIPEFKLELTRPLTWDNVFNVFPNRENANLIRTYVLANDGAGTYVYPNFSPYGSNGGYYYGRVTLTF